MSEDGRAGHWIAGWGREGFAAEHVTVHESEEGARDYQLATLVKIAPNTGSHLDEECAVAAGEIEDGYGATAPVDGRTHWVEECDRPGCAWPVEQCIEALKAFAGTAS